MPDEGSRTRKRLQYLAPKQKPAAPVPQDPRFAGWVKEGEFLYRRRLRFPGLGVDPWAHPFSPEAGSGEDLLFFDTETTGLSGGAGTLIFLVGLAWCEGPDLILEQLFLPDFPGEEEFLLAVREHFRARKLFVSFNGKTFDSHLLATRFRMNRLEFEIGPQLDLLHHSRRLWRAITGECSLKAIERGILEVHRELDVAGEDIPMIYFDFLRTGQPGTLPLVFEHNVTDVTTLARIYRTIGRLIDGDASAAPVDERALGSWLLGRASPAGRAILKRSFESGNFGAGAVLSLHHKRSGEWEDAVRIWESILESTRSLFAVIELAKYHEHARRNPARALQLVEALLSWGLPLDAATRGEIQRRKARLERKAAAKQ